MLELVWLSVCDELRECRDDNSVNGVHAQFKNVVDGDIGEILRQGRFVERYERANNATLHVHGVLKFPRPMQHRLNLCAVLQAQNSLAVDGRGPDVLRLVGLWDNDVEMSVLVNVGKLLKPS